MDTKKTDNAPNAAGQNLGGKTTNPKTEGGTWPASSTTGDPAIQNESSRVTNTSEPVKNSLSKTDPSSIASPSVEEATAAESALFNKTEENKEGVKRVISSVSEDQAKSDLAKQGNAPVFANETQRLEGSSYTNLTQDGTLNSDRSVRDERPIEEINKELEDKSGPNPIPLREGNERTKMEQRLAGGGVNMMNDIDNNTNALATRLDRLKENLDEEGKKELDAIQKELRTTGRF